jgi:hypothetical protein
MSRLLIKPVNILAGVVLLSILLFGQRKAVSQVEGFSVGPSMDEERYHLFINLLTNGDFEQDDDMDGFPDGWSPWIWNIEEKLDLRQAIFNYLETTPDAIIPPRLNTRYPFFGKRSLDIRSVDGKTGPGVYTTRTFAPGIYTLSLYAKNPGEGKRKLGLYLANGGRLFEVGKRWRNIVHTERVPFYIREGEVSMRDWTFSPGNLLIDRAVVIRLPFDIEYAKRMIVRDDNARFVIGFTDVGEVTIPVGINLEIHSPAGETVRKNIEGVLESPADEVVFDFNPHREGRYRLKLEVYDLRSADVIFKDHDIIAVREMPDDDSPGEAELDSERVPAKGAKVDFFPVGIRALGHELANLTGLGFNCILIVEPRAEDIAMYGKFLNSNKMKVFFEVNYEDVSGECDEDLLELIRLAPRLKGFSGWFVRGDYRLGTVDVPEGVQSLGCIREENPDMPLILENVLPVGGALGDIPLPAYVALDPNPVSIPLRPLFLMGLWADRFSVIGGTEIQTIGMPQIFGGWPIAHRSPEYREIRAMTYLAILHGAKGIIFREFSSLRPFFDQSDAAWDVRKVPDNWVKIPDLNEELIRLSSYFRMAPAEKSAISLDEKGYIDHRLWRNGENAILVAVNVYDGEIEGRFLLQADRYGEDVEILFENRSISIEENTFSDSFAPFETHIYRLSVVQP